MDGHRFDVLVRSVTESRRSLLGAALAAATGWLVPNIGETRKKHPHKKKRKKAQPNQYGCLEVGDRCKSADQCCSGICKGKKGKKRCRAHDTGTCIQGIPDACDPDNPAIAVCNSDVCLCLRTTAGSNFCADANLTACADCKKDADCEALGYPAGSACVPMTGGHCAGICEETGMQCRIPCGATPPMA
jgi:hypothetical protein